MIRRYTLFSLLLCLCTTSVLAEKICVRATITKKKSIKLARSVVASSAPCPRNFTLVMDSNELITTAAIKEGNLVDGSVTNSKLAVGSVSTSKIADNAISGEKIAPGGVAVGKLSSAGVSAGRFLAADGSGGAQFVALSSSNLPSNAAQLDRADQTFTGLNKFQSLLVLNDNGSFQTAPIGEVNRDNQLVAWARVTGSGSIDTDYNMNSVTRISTGHYLLQLASPVSSGFTLIPNVTPEVDQDGFDNPPTGAANMRVAVVNLKVTGAQFEVYMYNGTGTLVDNDFQVTVFGR